MRSRGFDVTASCLPTLGVLDRRRTNERLVARVAPLTDGTYDAYGATSCEQQRFWLLYQQDPELSSHNLSLAALMHGILNENALKNALREIIRRHDILRVRFMNNDGRIVQCVEPFAAWITRRAWYERIDRTDGAETEYCKGLIKRFNAEADIAFDWTRWPLIRVRLFVLSDQRSALLITTPRIVADTESMDVIWHEVEALYEAFVWGEPQRLEKTNGQYADYCAVKEREAQVAKAQGQLGHWKSRMEHLPQPQETVARERLRRLGGESNVKSVVLDRDLSVAIREVSRCLGTTSFVTLLAAFKVIRHFYSGRQIAVVGLSVSSRSTRELEMMVGPFTNTLVCGVDLADVRTFRQLTERINEVCVSAYANQGSDVEMFRSRGSELQQPSRAAEQRVLFQRRGTSYIARHMTALAVRTLILDRLSNQCEQEWSLAERNERFHVTVRWSTHLCGLETVARMLHDWTAILEFAVRAPDRPIAEFSPSSGW
jgi:hypothetical protein